MVLAAIIGSTVLLAVVVSALALVASDDLHIHG
jgi:hypothetical protein